MDLRTDIVSQAGFQSFTIRHCPYETDPVDPAQQSSERQQLQRLATCQSKQKLANRPFVGRSDKREIHQSGHNEQKTPDAAVRHQLKRIDGFKEAVEVREKSPNHLRGDRTKIADDRASRMRWCEGGASRFQRICSSSNKPAPGNDHHRRQRVRSFHPDQVLNRFLVEPSMIGANKIFH